ncbi:MAG: PspA/IM30 family protein [Gemmatimonadota bacterium]|nr:PspA/IM30 family protein [Gemmatimonadota bacterium]MDH3366361.1 PspA/IM30 family protein [Gemmatimonadota bacterium]MDH3477619.1 PspA/IM30 family protein [Gemmatimonadota bacterium]MDH3570643.1 PspA/IM30 family protein [Gemmatimonadota bacterium]MDH5551252.1 PspA/IM30 family protein [Gemmatimonadota bacterium]
MGIFQRLATVIKAQINALIGKAENPEKVLDQLLLEMRGQLAKTKQEVATAIADEKKLQAQVEKEKRSSEDWERRAMLAVQEGRDDLAKQALIRHNEHLQHAQAMHETWVRHKADVETLKVSLRELNDKIEDAKRKKNLLVARQRRAEAQGRIQETMSSMSNQSAFESFRRMEEKIEDMERQALAAAELAGELEGDVLGQQFKALEYKGTADNQLLELKRKMGMLPPGEGEDRRQLPEGEDIQEGEAEVVEDEEPQDR